MKNKVKVLKMQYIEEKIPHYNEEGVIDYCDYQMCMNFKVNGKKQFYRFITCKKSFIIAFLDDPYTSPIPKDKEIRRMILKLAYGELHKILGIYELSNYFYNEDKKEEEEQLRKQREEKVKRIALGEQISIEKYLLNSEKTIDKQ